MSGGGGGGGGGNVYELIIALVLYCVGNLWLTFFNSWAVRPLDNTYTVPGFGFQFACGGFKFAYFYTFFHTIMSCIGAFIILKIKKAPDPTWNEFWDYRWGLIPCAFLFTVNVACNNASLVTVSVFVNTIIKTLGPVPTMTAEYFYAKIVPTPQVTAAVAVVILGAIMVVEFKEGSSTMLGVIYVVTATIATSLRPVVAAELMSGKNKPKLNPAVLLFYEQSVAIVFMILFNLAYFTELQGAFEFLGGPHGSTGYIIILVGSLTAFSYNMITFVFTRAASALTVVITGNFLKVLLICLSAAQDNIFVKPIHDVGLVVFIAGLVAYAYFQFAAKQAKAKAKAAAQAPVEATSSTSDALPVVVDKQTGCIPCAKGPNEKTPLNQAFITK